MKEFGKQMEMSLGYLPKFIDVSLTLKFIESRWCQEDRVYDFDISKGVKV